MDDLERILAYIKENTVLTLCSERDSQPWAANCFYGFERTAMAFLVMTELETRHGGEMADNPHVAGTISSQRPTVARLRGLQFSGRALRLDGSAEEAGRSLYYRRFPFARLRPAPLWSISVDLFKMTDNRLGFGTKLHWRRGEAASR
ncbi:pyridoxamine 5'-phosphate oxidase family protein [Telmatospirillum siberiense]|uniref:Uncharacterized protein n=1 Tax=Telmatospirillum siberiense TaxID=382514 RepID=A0A2N3PQG1_9PROT|nr:pyridoxamine 5'-phosphate oxidase family protein [Telmatospirillum siberiense]PKU22640.1 hypothetical protein CWS72_20885 [Telmatospirillum siberiense]